ncbi:ABC transporter permease subunit [Cognatishimia sp. SS12]|nr:ABC transporter permease subunit [Cognatishimia sp. SS12]
MFTLWGRPEFLPAVWLTISSALAGLCIASVLGIVLGLIIGMVPALERTTRFLVDFGRSFPVIALFPGMLLLLGATTKMVITLVSIACFFPILIQAIYGARRLESTIRDTVRCYRLPPFLRFRRVVLPAAGPFIFTGVRIAIVKSILISFGIGVVSPVGGMGHELSVARGYFETDIAFAYAVYAGILGISVNAFSDIFEKRVLNWHLQSSGEV